MLGDTPKTTPSVWMKSCVVVVVPLSNPVAPASLLLAPQIDATCEAKEFHETFCALIEHLETCRHVFFLRKKAHQRSVDAIFSRDFHFSTVLGFETLLGKNPAIQQAGTSPAKKTNHTESSTLLDEAS